MNSSGSLLTFSKSRNLNGEADDPYQVLNGNQGAQDGSDPKSLTLTSLDQLQDQKPKDEAMKQQTNLEFHSKNKHLQVENDNVSLRVHFLKSK